jgi:hypothetical protein
MGSREQKTPNNLSIFYMRCRSDEKMEQLVRNRADDPSPPRYSRPL